MKEYKNQPTKNLFTNQKEKETFMSLFNDFDEVGYKEVAKLLFCDGVTQLKTAEITNYSLRQIERLNISLLKVALKRAVKELVRIGVIPNDR